MRRKDGFTLIELLVVMGIISLVISILLPSLVRARELVRRAVCMTNMKAIADGQKTYAGDRLRGGPWPYVWGFIGPYPIGYEGTWQLEPGVIGRGPPDYPPRRYRALTSLLFLFVRSGVCSPEHFVCPSDDNAVVQETVDRKGNWDFMPDEPSGKKHVSYSYAVPFGDYRRIRRPEAVAALADRSPATSGNPVGPWSTIASDNERRERMSQNHSSGEVMHVMWADSHVSPTSRADIGIDKDCIWSVGIDQDSTDTTFGRADDNDSVVVGPY